jgi:hypothetical protein
MKTISELNSKWWYRLIKIVYILIFVVACGTALVISYSEVGSYQNDHTVTCNYGNKSTFLAYKDKRIYVPFEDYSISLANLPENIKKEIQTACAISDAEMKEKIDTYFNGTSDGKKLYEIIDTKVVVATYLSATLWSLLSLLIIVAIFEVLRRAFYYVVLGALRPQK